MSNVSGNPPSIRVLIAPARVRNLTTTTTTARRVGSPHRPCEGSQQLASPGWKPGASRPHRPCEGSQPHSSSRSLRCGTGPHRPCEGSQHGCYSTNSGDCEVLIAPARVRNRSGASSSPTAASVLIAPARVRNCGSFGECGGSAPGPHRPCEGSQRGPAAGGPSGGLTGPHRPCEGSQPARTCHVDRSSRSSSPLRGFATCRDGLRARRDHVLIAPARVRNEVRPRGNP